MTITTIFILLAIAMAGTVYFVNSYLLDNLFTEKTATNAMIAVLVVALAGWLVSVGSTLSLIVAFIIAIALMVYICYLYSEYDTGEW